MERSRSPALLPSSRMIRARHRDITDFNRGHPPSSPPPKKFPQQPKAFPGTTGGSHLGSRLPTFHHEPELLGGPFREGKNVRDGAHGVRHE